MEGRSDDILSKLEHMGDEQGDLPMLALMPLSARLGDACQAFADSRDDAASELVEQRFIEMTEGISEVLISLIQSDDTSDRLVTGVANLFVWDSELRTANLNSRLITPLAPLDLALLEPEIKTLLAEAETDEAFINALLQKYHEKLSYDIQYFQDYATNYPVSPTTNDTTDGSTGNPLQVVVQRKPDRLYSNGDFAGAFYRFVVRACVQVHDPASIDPDITLGITVDGMTDGEILVEDVAEYSSPEHIDPEVELAEHLTGRFNNLLNPLGMRSLEIVLR